VRVLAGALATASLAAGLLGAQAVASAGVSGPSIHVTSPGAVSQYHRTASRQPVFDIEASGGATLQCAIDSIFKLGPCGPPAPGCTAQLCATYKPPAPLSIGGFAQGRHSLQVALLDGGGDTVASAEYDFEIDTTPPGTQLSSPDPPVFRPIFTFAGKEDGVTADHFQCSLTSLRAAAAWYPCKADVNGTQIPKRLALKHKRRDYRFEVRAIDDLGRPDPTPAVTDFNPVPCTVRARSVSLGRLVASGLPVRVHCSFEHQVNVHFAFRNSTVFDNPSLGQKVFRGTKGRWTASGRVPVAHFAVSFVKHRKALPLGVIATGSHGGGWRYGISGYQKLNLRR
jgi:hypothetical protein